MCKTRNRGDNTQIEQSSKIGKELCAPSTFKQKAEQAEQAGSSEMYINSITECEHNEFQKGVLNKQYIIESPGNIE